MVTVSEVVDRLVEGVYQPGQYVRSDDLAVTQGASYNGDQSAEFHIETTTPNTDRRLFKVTVERVN